MESKNLAEPLSRAEAKAQLESWGAKVQSSVSRQTDLLIVGNDQGQVKYNNALRKNVAIMPWVMFVSLGFWEKRGPYRLDGPKHSGPSIDQQVLSHTLLFLGIQLDNIYAHLVTGNSNGHLWAAFRAGSRGLDLLLQAAWGASQSPGSRGIQDDFPSLADDDPDRLLRWGIAGVKGMIRYLEMDSPE